MICQWNSLLSILPLWMRSEVDRLGKNDLQELRLRQDKKGELILKSGEISLQRVITRDDLNFVINAASRYSPWTASTAAQGYITAQGGHRIGMCGECVMQSNTMTGIRNIRSLCIRVARDFPGIAHSVPKSGSALILGPPGSGKTTLLRDIIRNRAETAAGSISVIDERGELFPPGFSTGKRADVLTGCDKVHGVEIALKTMGPSCIAVDEITSKADCEALIQAGWCGVSLLASVHASCKEDLFARPVYAPLAESGIFDTLIILRPDKSWRLERMGRWK